MCIRKLVIANLKSIFLNAIKLYKKAHMTMFGSIFNYLKVIILCGDRTNFIRHPIHLKIINLVYW